MRGGLGKRRRLKTAGNRKDRSTLERPWSWKSRGVFRGSMGEMAYLPIYIYIYIYVVDFCGKCKWTDIYSTIHGSFGYGRCQVWQFENVSLIHGSEFVLLIELSTLMYCLVYPGNWTWFKLRLVWRVELMEMCCKTMFPSWWVCLHTETLFQCGMYVDLGK